MTIRNHAGTIESSLVIPSINKLFFQNTHIIWGTNKCNSFKNNKEKLETSMNSLDECMSDETFRNEF